MVVIVSKRNGYGNVKCKSIDVNRGCLTNDVNTWPIVYLGRLHLGHVA